MAIERLPAYFNAVVNINPTLEAVLRESFILQQFKKGQTIASAREKVSDIRYLNKGISHIKGYLLVVDFQGGSRLLQ